MIAKIIDFIRKLFEQKATTRLPYSDEYYDREIEEKEKRLEMFHEVVGKSPMDQIDYIIEHGMEEFNSKRIEIEEQVRIEVEVGDYVSVDKQYIEDIGFTDDFEEEEELYESIDLDEIVICKSIVQGRMRFFSALSGNSFEWQEYGDIQKMTRREYRELFQGSGLVEIVESSMDSWEEFLSAAPIRGYKLGGIPANELKQSKIVNLEEWKRSLTKNTERGLVMDYALMKEKAHNKLIKSIGKTYNRTNE